MKGRSIAYNLLVLRGLVEIITITEKETSNSPFFVRISHVQPANITADLKTDIENVTLKGLESLNITDGVSHSEVIIVNGEVKIIEIGGRMGGDYIGSHLTKLSTGINLVDVAIDISLGTFEWESAVVKEHQPAGITFLMSEKDGVLCSSEKKEIIGNKIIKKILTAEIGDRVVVPTSSCKRFRYILYTGNKVTKLDAMKHFGLKVIS